MTTKLNDALTRAESATGRKLGRVVRMNVAQGGTTSYWAALMADALHGRLPHILVWEYSINDHAVALEASSRMPRDAGTSAFVAETMRYMLDFWLRRSLSATAILALAL